MQEILDQVHARAPDRQQFAIVRLWRPVRVAMGGDLVLVKRTEHQIKNLPGPNWGSRFTEPRVYRVVKAVGGDSYAYHLVDHAEPAKKIMFSQPVTKNRLIKLDMPELEDEGVKEPRPIEVQSCSTTRYKCTINTDNSGHRRL